MHDEYRKDPYPHSLRHWWVPTCLWDKRRPTCFLAHRSLKLSVFGIGVRKDHLTVTSGLTKCRQYLPSEVSRSCTRGNCFGVRRLYDVVGIIKGVYAERLYVHILRCSERWVFISMAFTYRDLIYTNGYKTIRYVQTPSLRPPVIVYLRLYRSRDEFLGNV